MCNALDPEVATDLGNVLAYEELVFIESYPKSSFWCCKASTEGQYQG
jgi:hypothetical protein